MHIDLGHVLRGTVCDEYSNLVTRPTGAAVRTAIEAQVGAFGAVEVTTLDFSQVNLLDFSCADEIVAKLLLRFTGVDAPAGYLTFRGIHDGHLDPIETVLERHALAMVSWHEGAAELFGVVDGDERRLWEVVRDHGPVEVAQVAGLLDIEQAAALHQLERLVSRRLLMQRERRYAVPMAAPNGVRGTA